MPEVPTIGQLLLLAVATLAFAAGGVVSVARVRWNRESLRLAAKSLLYIGLLLAGAVLIWHSVSRGSWIPLEDNFDALIWLGVLLALFVQYVQRSKPLGGLEWFCLPIVIILLIAAGVFGRAKPQEYLDGTWQWTHRVSAFGGLFAFFIAGVSGAMYLIKQRQLRSRQLTAGPKFASLERLEHITFSSVTLGFALLTIGLVTGLVLILKHDGRTSLGEPWIANPKVVLTLAVWVVYAIVLHAPINPSFRGRKAALLSVFGLVLVLGTLIAVQYVPTGGPR